MSKKAEEKKETAKDVMARIVAVEMPKVLKEIMDDKDINIERKTKLISQLSGTMTMLRVIRASLEEEG